VNIWQRFVYAGQDIHAAAVYVLCDEFALNLDADESHDRAPGGAA
jgi:hypothetical protein